MQLLMEIDMYILVHFIAEGFVLLVVLSILMDYPIHIDTKVWNCAFLWSKSL